MRHDLVDHLPNRVLEQFAELRQSLNRWTIFAVFLEAFRKLRRYMNVHLALVPSIREWSWVDLLRKPGVAKLDNLLKLLLLLMVWHLQDERL